MSYIKYGITTKIKLINYGNNKANKYLKDNFDLSLFYKKEDSYYLHSDILSDNISSFRNEIMDFTNGNGDSLDNCEAYCLNMRADQLLKHKIVLCDDNERYYFDNNSNFKFDTDNIVILEGSLKIKVFLIPIYWDVSRVEFESFISVANFINRLVRFSTNNVLKDASFFVVV